MASGLSKYAERLSARRRDCAGRMFQPLTDNGTAVPLPRPFSWDYHPNHENVISVAKEDAFKLLPHEIKNIKQITYFRQPHRE